MPNRQYFCWQVCLKFQCGCTEWAKTKHVCNPNRGVTCNEWRSTRNTYKHCNGCRARAGLHALELDVDVDVDDQDLGLEFGLDGGGVDGEDGGWQVGEKSPLKLTPQQYGKRAEDGGGNAGSDEQGPRRRVA